MHLRSPDETDQPATLSTGPNLFAECNLFPLANYRITPPIIANGSADAEPTPRPLNPRHTWLAPEALGRRGSLTNSSASQYSIPPCPLLNPHTSPSPTDHHDDTRVLSRPTRRMEKLGYEVIDYSSYNADFYPDNIKVNQPTAGRSRWSSGAGDQHQFLTLKLDRPCLLQSITFGKFSRKHICNLKEFKVLAAATENHWVEILLSGLRDDSEPESFTVRNTLHGGRVPFPIQWLKVVPLMAYELKFNFSIWYLELRGVQDPAVVQPLVAQYQHYCERVALRMCLKVIRDLNPQRFDLQGMIRPLPADQPPIQLENPLVTDMRAAALGGHFDRLESMLTTCNANGLLNDYIRSCPYSAQWERVLPRSGPSPGGRGAHQMCMDPVGGHLYLFGGWSGTQSLSDFWRYHLESCQWELISADTAQQGGPGPRNYHTMCCCPQTQVLYLLGRYVDPDQRGENSLDSDFYAYHIHTNSWERLSVNTELDGGPRLSFDLEMTVDAATQQLFVFGGRTINSDARECVYSGLYRYSIPNKTWTVLRPDVLPTDVDAALRTRMEQSTLLDPRSRQLLIIATQRENTGQGDFTVYDMDTDTVFEKVTPHTNNSIVYDRRYTHRATYDPDRQEIIVFTGWAYNPSLKGQGTESSDIVSTLWSYHVPSETWTPIFRTHSRNGISDPLTPPNKLDSVTTLPHRRSSSVSYPATSPPTGTIPGAVAPSATIPARPSPTDTSPAQLSPGAELKSCPPSQSSAAGSKCRAGGSLAMSGSRRSLAGQCPRFLFYLDDLTGPRLCTPEKSVSSPTVPVATKASSGAEFRSLGMAQETAPTLSHSPPASPTFPCARIAHQLVYDERHRTHYLFGGVSFSPSSPSESDPGLPFPAPSSSVAPPAPPPSSGSPPLDLANTHPVAGALATGGNAPFIHPFCSSSAASWTRRHSLHPNHRLNDLWALQLRKPTATDVIKRMKFLVRRQHFLEMCILAPQARPMHSGMDSAHSTSVSSYVTAYHSSLNPPPSTYDYQRILKAIQYLQNQLAELVDFDNPLQVAAFHRLPVALLHDWPKDAPTREQLIHGSRRVLFDDLLAFFPDTVKEPAGSLVDMVVPWMEAEAGMA
ncbi:hypothetical protein H4R33_003683 [Dimargaris cristalligena]|nr:hypothetical protein H4R33_003683 [Dimargaris cristalligena]